MPTPSILFLILAASLAACEHDGSGAPAVGTQDTPPAPPSADAKQAFQRGLELYQTEQVIGAL